MRWGKGYCYVEEYPSIKMLGNFPFGVSSLLCLLLAVDSSSSKQMLSYFYYQELVQCESFLSALRNFYEVHHSIIIENVHSPTC